MTRHHKAHHTEKDTYRSVTEQRQASFLYGLSIITLVSLSLYGVFDLFTNRYLDLVLITLLGVYYTTLIFVVRAGKVELGSFMIAVIGGAGYFFVGYNDSTGDSGLFLFNTYPVLAFFLLGRRKGLVWTLGFAALMLTAFLLHRFNIVPLPYSNSALRDCGFSFLITVVMIYFYQDLISAGERIIEQRDRQLAEERDRAKAMLASIGEGVFVIDKYQRFIAMNPVVEKLFGVSASEAIRHKHLKDLVRLTKGDQELPFDEYPLIRTLHTGEAAMVGLDDNIYCHPYGGMKFPVAIISTPLNHEGSVSGAVVVFRDITKDKQAATIIDQKVKEGTIEVRQTHAKLEASIESLNIGFIMTNIEGETTLVNTASFHILDTLNETVKQDESKKNKLGKPTLETINEVISKDINLVETVKKCIKGHKTYEYNDVTYGGKFLHIFISPIRSGTDILGAVVLVEDITEAKVLDRSKDEFFSIASHELRTPLTAIRSYSTLIEKRYVPQLQDKGFAIMVKGIHDSCLRLIDIVNDFLNMSRLEQKRLIFNTTAFDMVALAEEVRTELRPVAEQKHLSLNLEHAGGFIPLAWGDKARVKEILINLVSNAVKFTEIGSVTIAITHNGPNLEIRVKDTGKGVSERNQALLFRKFQQAGSSIYTQDASHGTGLGLYISKLMIENMGGTIYLESSAPGRGSVFTFTLPASQHGEEKNPPDQSSPTETSTSNRVETEKQQQITQPTK